MYFLPEKVHESEKLITKRYNSQLHCTEQITPAILDFFINTALSLSDNLTRKI